MVDGRNVELPRFRKAQDIHTLCLLHDVDGIAIINEASSRTSGAFPGNGLYDVSGICTNGAQTDGAIGNGCDKGVNGIPENGTIMAADFRLEIYDRSGKAVWNPAAARCSVAFADLLGVKPFHTQDYAFETLISPSEDSSSENLLAPSQDSSFEAHTSPSKDDCDCKGAGTGTNILHTAHILSHLGECKEVVLGCPPTSPTTDYSTQVLRNHPTSTEFGNHPAITDHDAATPTSATSFVRSIDPTEASFVGSILCLGEVE